MTLYNLVVKTFNQDTFKMEVLFEGILTLDTTAAPGKQNITKITSDSNTPSTDNLLIDGTTKNPPDAQPYTDIFDSSSVNFFPKNGVLIDMRNYDTDTVQKYLKGSDVPGKFIKTIRCFTDTTGKPYMQVVSDEDNPIFGNGIEFDLSPYDVNNKFVYTLPQIPLKYKYLPLYTGVVGVVLGVSVSVLLSYKNKKKLVKK